MLFHNICEILGNLLYSLNKISSQASDTSINNLSVYLYNIFFVLL